jgi:16S rRNA processing protein RimM
VLYLGPYKNPEVIETYRTHKQYDMVKFKGIDYINDVLKYKGNAVYVNEEDIVLDDDEILESELVGVEVYNDEVLVGTISEYRSDNGNRMIRVNDKLIPYNEDFITKVSRSERKIYMSNIGVFL